MGNAAVDILVRGVDQVEWGTTTWVQSVAWSIGGNGANTSYALAKFGVPVRLLSAVGDDDFGRDLVARLGNAGVDTSRVELSALEGTPVSIGLVNSNCARALLHRSGISRSVFAGGIELTNEVVSGCNRLHLANIFPLTSFRQHAPRLLREARARGLATSLDTGWDTQGLWMDTLRPCLDVVDLVFMNEDEAKHLTGASNPELAAQILGKDTVIKLGAQGCYVSIGDQRFFSPAMVVEAVDSTGAGDCFAGGFLAALQRGLGVRDAARYANAAGAASVSTLGCVAGLKSFEILGSLYLPASDTEPLP